MANFNTGEYSNNLIYMIETLRKIEPKIYDVESYKRRNWNSIFQPETYQKMTEEDRERSFVEFINETPIGGFSGRTVKYQKDLKQVDYQYKTQTLPIAKFATLIQMTSAEIRRHNLMISSNPQLPIDKTLMAVKYKNALKVYQRTINDAFFYGTKDGTLTGLLRNTKSVNDYDTSKVDSNNLVDFIFKVFVEIITRTDGVVVPDFVGLSSVAYSTLAMITSKTIASLPDNQNGIQYLEYLLNNFVRDYGKSYPVRIRPLGELKVTITDANPLGDILIIDTNSAYSKMYFSVPYIVGTAQVDADLFRTKINFEMTDIFTYGAYTINRVRFNEPAQLAAITESIPNNVVEALKEQNILTGQQTTAAASEKKIVANIKNLAVDVSESKA